MFEARAPPARTTASAATITPTNILLLIRSPPRSVPHRNQRLGPRLDDRTRTTGAGQPPELRLKVPGSVESSRILSKNVTWTSDAATGTTCLTKVVRKLVDTIENQLVPILCPIREPAPG